MRKSSMVLLLGLSCWAVQAQQGPAKDLRGRVMDDTTALADVHILNLSSKKGSISDPEGYFTITVALGDTLRFSALAYQRKQIVVGAELYNSPYVQIPLIPFVNELDEVVLSLYGLTGNLTEDMSNLEMEPEVSRFSLNLPNAGARTWTQSERHLNEATTGGGIVPLNPILNGISGRTKMLKKRLARDRLYDKSEHVRGMFADSLFVTQLHIPEDRIPDFMYFCEVDPEFKNMPEWDTMNLWALLIRKSKAYRENNGLEK